MLNKVETAGVALSIAAMVLALWFLRVETANETLSNLQQTDENAAVYVADGENQRAALADAIYDASGGTGKISKMIVDDIVVGTGAEVTESDTVTVNYIGTLQNGQQFDNSYLKGEPFTFTVGEGRVIAGWEEGVQGMQVGGQRILVIPPDKAYGRDGFGPIPGSATLVFAIELVQIQ